MRAIIQMFVAMMLITPFGATSAQDLTKEIAELYEEHAVVNASDMKLVQLLKEQAPKLASQRASLAMRQAELAGSQKKFNDASDEYRTSCKVFFPKKAPCAKEKARLALWETSLEVLRNRTEKHAAALQTEEWYFAVRQSLHEVNLRHLANIERYVAFEAKNPPKRGGLRACFSPLASAALVKKR